MYPVSRVPPTSSRRIVHATIVALVAVAFGACQDGVPTSPGDAAPSPNSPPAAAAALGTLPASMRESGGATSNALSAQAALSVQVQESGLISLSVDGVGTSATTGIVEVEKPAGATVRSAWLATASTGSSGIQLAPGAIQLDGQGVTFPLITPSSIGSFNHFADVTSLLAAKLDAAPAGRVSVEITEANSGGVDGSALAVIFEDPSQTSENTIVLFFGAQDVNGDNFVINLASPADPTDPDLVLDLGLGISFGCQGSSLCGTVNNQFTSIDVNGERLTSFAGGLDDGELANGALVTVGGLDDTNDNPAPNVVPDDGDTRFDDELYDLVPFVASGDQQIDVFTINPSNDDNIFFASLFLSVAAEVTSGEADVSLTKDADAASVAVGGQIVYTIEVANAGPDEATLAQVTDDLPAGVSFVSATASQGSCSEASGTVTCDLGTIASGAGATIEITVQATADGSVVNEATVSSSTTDPATGNNTDQATVQVTGDGGQPGQCFVIDFEGEGGHGDVVDSFDLDGTTITLTVAPRGSQSAAQAALYSTDNVDGPDPDLEWQGAGPECGDCQGQGSALVIVSNLGFDTDGDSGSGGAFVLTGFSPGAYVLRSFTAIDADGASFRALVDGANAGGSGVAGNGSVQQVQATPIPIQGELRLDLGTDSGAVDDLEICEVGSDA